MSIRLHVERLVIDGSLVRVGDRRALEAAVIGALESRLRADGLPGLPASGLAVPRLDAPPAALRTGAGAPALGAAIGDSVHAAIGGRAR